MNMKRLLEEGDVFKLKLGMKVEHEIPQKLFVSNRPLSNERESKCITIGEIYSYNFNNLQTQIGDLKNEIRKQVFYHLGIDDQHTDKEIVKFVNNIVKKKKDTLNFDMFDSSKLIGNYVVTKVEVNKVSYDGHFETEYLVSAAELIPNYSHVDHFIRNIQFIQYGFRDARIEKKDVEFVKKMRKQWV